MTNRAFSRTLNNGRLNINIDLSLMCSRKNGTVLSPVFLCRLYTLEKGLELSAGLHQAQQWIFGIIRVRAQHFGQELYI